MTIRFTDFIQIKDAASFKDAFEESVSKKVFEALEAKKIEVAQGFFGESHKGMCPECDKPMTKCSCEESVQESASSERKGDASANGYRAHSIQVADAAASAAADHHKMLFQSHISKHAEATGAGDSQAAHHHMEKAKMHASVHYEMTGKHVYEETNTGFGDHYPTEKNPKARIKGSLPGTKDYPTAPNAGFKGKVPSSGMKIHDKTNEEVEYMDEAASEHGTESSPLVVKTPRGRTIGTVHYSPTGNKGHGIKGPHYVAVHHNHGPYADFAGKTSTQHWESPKGRSAEVRDRAIRSMKRARERVSEEVDNKHGKVALKVTKKLMKIAHKHAKKHHEEEE